MADNNTQTNLNDVSNNITNNTSNNTINDTQYNLNTSDNILNDQIDITIINGLTLFTYCT